MKNRVALPVCIYAVTAIWCWVLPWRLMTGGGSYVTNIFPTRTLALTSVALAVVHWAFPLRGRVVVAVAGLWAAATAWMVTLFVVHRGQTPVSDSIVTVVYILTLAAAACALCVLGWLLLRRRLAVDANWIARGGVVLGVAGLAFNYGALALRSAGVLKQPSGLYATADVIAGLTLNLWISSVMLVFGAVTRVVSSRLRSSTRPP